MRAMEEIIENYRINIWANHFLRSPIQINKPHYSDAELIELPGVPERYLAITIDTVSEEISTGLYRDPYTMGWVTVMASASDLAAVGADIMGLVISVSIDQSKDEEFSIRIAQGMSDACRLLNTFIVGGDLNESKTIALTGCAFGTVPRNQTLTRIGCRPGDLVYVSGTIGDGNALGLVRISKLPEEYFPEESYRPHADILTGTIIRDYATCCMDTSDGLLNTLDQLMRLNNVGFRMDCNLRTLLSPKVVELCDRTSTPHWMMTAGTHGEFKLLFTIHPDREIELLTRLRDSDIYPIRVGKVQSSPEITLVKSDGREIGIDPAPLRNLIYSTDSDLKRYLQEFKNIGKKWGLD